MADGFEKEDQAEALKSDALQDQARAQMSADEIYALARHSREERDYQMEAYWYEMLLMYRDIKDELLVNTEYYCGEAYFDAGNEKEALHWFEKAARHGHKKAKLRCGRMFSQSKEDRDQEKALYWLEQAAEEGNPEIQHLCGDMYCQGRGTSVNYARALYWYEKAAPWGNASTNFARGMMYYTGEGSVVDHAKAFDCLKKAAGGKHPEAQYQCGWMYQHGEGIYPCE